ncbi:MAG TPA: Ig-like domain-containing protein [Candidatus Baltobacteraceae bacterium]|nr:Ig-like domain-containing protein [Candidatus Baltobacteraceae bacterium]
MRGRFGLAALSICAVLAACGRPASQPQRLAFVAPLPSPAVPRWITGISPRGTVDNRAQIRVIFASPVLPVEALGSSRENDVLSHFHITPALPGGFVVLTPRMIGFQADGALPAATRVQVRLTSGLRDLQGRTLDRDLAWTFDTGALRFSVPKDEPTPGTVSLQPVIHVQANAPIDMGSFTQHASFESAAGDIPASAVQESPSPGDGTIVYDVTPKTALGKATPYTLKIAAGVLPAFGNLPNSRPLSVGMTTYSPLAFATAQPTADPLTSTGSPRFQNGDPAIVFNNALDPKTYAKHLRFDPQLKSAGQPYSLSDGGNAVLVNPYALAPNTTYTVAIDAGMQDVYGQHLGSAVQTRYRTGNYAPYFWAPTGTNRFITTQGLQLQYSAIDLPANAYRARYRVLDAGTLANIDDGSAGDLLGPDKSWPSYTVSGASPNRPSNIDVPLGQELGARGGVLAYGAAADIGNTPYAYTGLVQLTNLGVFAQWFPQGGTVMVQHLDDGSPVSGANVSVYATNLFASPSVPARLCASGTTGAGGTLTLTGNGIQSCYAGNRPDEQAPELYVAVQSAGDWAYVRTYDWSGIYQYSNNIGDTTWSNGQPISRGVVYSDRQMYQPGERGWFTAVCYVLQNGVLRADRNAAYRVTLRDPNGNQTALPARTTNRFATFSFPVDFKKSQAPGYYTIVAKSPDGAEITGSFRVAEFRPPNFSVNLKLDRDFAAAGGAVSAQGSAQYLFGAPMSGAAARLHVTREQTALSPKGWDDFTFGRQWFWPEQQPDVPADAGDQEVTLDAKGAGSATVTVAPDLPYAMTYRVDLEVTDVSHLASSATQSFTAVPGTTLIGLRSDFVGTVNTPISTALVAVDPAGKTEPGTRVHVELQKMEYSGATQIVEGSEAARNQVQYTTVAQADVTTGERPQTISLTAKDAGSYRIRANLAGAANDATATDTQVWITGPGQAAWGQENPSQLQLKLDKRNYRPGEVATVAVASPYDKADLYLSVVRDTVLYKTVIHVNGSAPRVRVPVSQAMFPNAAVEGVLVRRGAAIGKKNAQSVDSLVRIGMVPLALDLRAQYLTAKITPAQGRIEPHSQQRIHLQLRDASGKPVQGQFTVAVVNDAILHLSGYRPPDLVQTVFAAQPIATRFADNRPGVTLAQPSDVAQKGWGYGGGFLAGAAGTRVRAQFVPFAYFNGAVETGANGQADISFTTPDNLTTWRVLAVGVTAEDRPRFVTSDATFITTKPLVTDPLLPQFARPGDRFDAGMLLMNAGSQSVDARTQALLSGDLAFASPAGSQTLQAQQQFAAGMNAWRFPMVVNGAGSASIQFRTTIGKRGSDAFRVPLDIRTAGVSETTMDSGATKSNVSIPIEVAGKGGTVRIDAAASLIPQIAQPAKSALSSDRLALLTPVAGRLSIAASVLAMQRALGSPVQGMNAGREAATDVSQLAGMQRIDGGFGFWPHARASDLFGTADAVRALAYASAYGADVRGLLGKAKPYLVRALADPQSAAKWCGSRACILSARFEMLRALAAMGDRRTDFLQTIYDARRDLALAQQLQLAVYLQQTPGRRAQADVLAAELSQRVYLTGRYANLQPQDVWSGSLVQAQAAYVQLLAARAAPAADRDRALQALVAQQCKCGWPGVDDTAAAMRAVIAYTRAQHTAPNFTATLELDGRPAGTAHFTGFNAPAHTFTLGGLSSGSHTIVLRKSGAGTLHYLLSYTYALAPDSPGRLAGLRVRRTVRPANVRTALATIDIAPQADPLTFPAGNVYDMAVQVVVDHPVDRVVITDPLPAGFEALDTSFQTSAAYYQPLSDDWQIDYQQIYRDRVTAFAQHLDPGVYTLHYLARSVTPGEFLWPGTSAYLLNAPEQFGRAAFRTVHVGS